MFDAKHARTISTAIARLAAAIHRGTLPARDLASGCAVTIADVKAAAARMGAKHRAHALLLVRPITTACTSINLASAAPSDGARQHLLDQAQAAIGLALTGAQALQTEIAPVAVHGNGDLMDGIDFLGADDGSDDSGGFFGNVLKTVGGLAQGAVTYAKGEKAKGDAATDADAKLQAAIAADSTATLAVAQALMSDDLARADPSKGDAALADKMMADSAVAAQVQAGAAVPASVQSKRVEAAQKAVTGAQARLAAALKGTNAGAKSAAKFTLLAAQQTLAKAQGGGGAMTKAGGGALTTGEDGGFGILTKKLGPLPRYAYALIAAGGYVGYRFLKRKSA